MKNLLINCYYDGMTVKEAITFITNSYHEEPTEKAIQEARALIRSTTNKNWK